MMVPYRRGGFRGLADDTCQVPQPGVPMYYPACPTSAPVSSGIPAATYTVQPAPASYVAPNYVPVPACSLDTRPGGAAFSAECIAAVLAAQQANMALSNDANRDVFVANCNRDWEANAAQYQALGMAVPPNDCAYRGYGQTIPGISPSGSYVGYLPGTPQNILDWRAANPGGGSPGPASATAQVSHEPAPAVSQPAAATPAPSTLAITAKNYVSAAKGFLTEDVQLAGHEFPIWALAAAAGVALVMFSGGRR